MKYIKTYEVKSKGAEIIYTFNTKAISGKYEYSIHLLQGNPKYDNTNGYSYNGIVLSIENTPGSWFVSTFLHYDPNHQYSDKININGNEWICTNRREIREELLEWLKTEYPMLKAIKQYNL